MQFTLIADLDLETLESWWRALESRSNNHFFLSWVWVGSWLRCYSPSFRLLKGEKNGQIVLLAIWVESQCRIKGLIPVAQWQLHRTGNPAQDQVWIEYNDMLADATLTLDEKSSAIQFLCAQEPNWDELVVGASEQPALDVFVQSSLSGIELWESPSYQVDLKRLRKEGLGYKESLSRNTRYQLNRALKKLNGLGEVKVAIAKSSEDALDMFQRAGPYHLQKWGQGVQGSGYSNPEFCRFHIELIKRGYPEGVIELRQLTVGGRPAVIHYNFLYRGRVYFYLVGVNYNEFGDGKLKIGMLMHLMAIDDFLEQGYEYYDFMAGASQYKQSMGEQAGSLHLYRFRRPSIKRKVEDFARSIRARMSSLSKKS